MRPGRVGDAAQNRELIGHLSNFRKMLTANEAGQRRVNRFELATRFRRRFRLHIERVEMSRPSGQIEKQNGIRRRSRLTGCLTQPQPVRKRQPGQAKEARFECRSA